MTRHPAPTHAAEVRPYTRPAVLLHWLMAVLIVAAFGVGLTLDDMPLSPQKLKLINWHKWTGVTILALAALRLAWRLGHPPPPPVPMPRWQHVAAESLHRLLYVLFFAVPISGWAYSSAAGFPIVWFGIVPLPDLVAPDKALARQIREVHEVLAWTLAFAVIGHVGAALKHQLIDRDHLLARMRWSRSPR